MSFSRLSAFALVAALAACSGEENNATNNSTTGGNNMTTGGNNTSTAGNNMTTSNNTSTSGNNMSTGTNNANSTTGTNNTTAAMCAGDTPTACFANGECAADQRCEDLSGADMPCCVVGARGAKETGAECDSENECASGVCIGRNDDPNICSEDCGATMDCGDSLECVQVPFTGGSGMWCVTPG